MKQAVRGRRASATVESVIHDIRYGLRQMRRNPAFTLTAVMTLGLGIGATTAIFSAVYALLIRPLPYPGSNRLMEISEAVSWERGDWFPLLSQDFVAARSGLKSFPTLAGYVYDDEDPSQHSGDQNLTGAGNPLRVKVVRITANLLPVLHVTPAEGRNFLSSEDREDGPAVALLSHRLRESRFDGNSGMIGHPITFGGKAWTVVGVPPAHFIFPDPALQPDICIPANFTLNTSLGTTKASRQNKMTIFF